MYEFFSLMIHGDANRWNNLWTMGGALASVITTFIARKVYKKTKKLVLDRYLNEDIPVDIFEDLTFRKEYESKNIDEPSHKIEIGQTNNVYIITKKSTIDGESKPNRHRGTLEPLGGYKNIIGNHYAGKFYITSEPFDNKILAIRDLSQYTDINEKYGIFKKNS